MRTNVFPETDRWIHPLESLQHKKEFPLFSEGTKRDLDVLVPSYAFHGGGIFFSCFVVQ